MKTLGCLLAQLNAQGYSRVAGHWHIFVAATEPAGTINRLIP
jgi:hypothetical protein